MRIQKEMNDKLANAKSDEERAKIRRRRPGAGAALAQRARKPSHAATKADEEADVPSRSRRRKHDISDNPLDGLDLDGARRRVAEASRGPRSGAMSPAEELTKRTAQRLLGLLTRLSYEQREVTLASGAKSNFYIDCKQTVLTAEGHFLVGSLFGRILAERAPEVEAIGGVTVGADPLASAVSTLSYIAGRPLPAFYVRKEAKGHGTAAWIEGTKSLRPGMPVAILEDVVTTGGSALKAIARVREHGLKVAIILGIVDREEGGREALEKEAPLVTLFRRRDFL